MRRIAITRLGAAVILTSTLFVLQGCPSRIRRVQVEDRVARLKRDLGKVRFALRTTKVLISRARGARYLPNLYNRLAELYVEQARYQYQIAHEKQKNKSAGVVSVQAKLLKNQAIATYRRLLALFPDYPDADKVMFFMAHEMRELGEYEKMLQAYQDLADKYPKSEYRLEGLLVMGDYWFDKSKLDLAEKYYGQVLASAETRVHAMARYKLAWCKINRANFKSALKLFEGSIRAARRFLPKAGARTKKLDLRREALVDSVFCYTEVHKPKGALRYFKKRADSKTTYLAALDKLGNRYYVKQKWPATLAVYREILSLTGDVEDAVEYAHRLFESVTQGKLYQHGAADVAALTRVLQRRYYNAALTKKKRQALYKQFEKYTRFIATKLQDFANEKKETRYYLRAARAYRAYLAFAPFRKDKNASAVRGNLAEVLYSAKRYIEAGKYYEMAAKGQKGKARGESTYTAVVSYFEALKLKGKKRLSQLDVVLARAGLRRAGAIYIREFPKASEIRQVKFNIARTHYDAGNFDEAILFFTALVEQFPNDKEATVAAHLVLDSYRNREDYDGLIAAGTAFKRISSLGDASFKGEITQIIKGAENALLRTETIKATTEEGENSDTLERIAAKYKGTALGEKAMLNAFVTARNARDPEKVFEVGERLIQAYPNSKQLSDVLATMGKLALDSLQFARGARYLEKAARSKTGRSATNLYKAAGEIRARLGDRKHSERDLNVLLRSSGSAKDKADLAVMVARLHVEANDWPAVIGLLQRASNAGASSGPLSYLLGYALFRQGQLASAQGYLGQAVQGGRGGNDAAKDAAAAAQFYLGEIAFKAFSQVQLTSDLSQLGNTLQQKLGFLGQTRQAYTSVGSLGSAEWTVAALGRLASVDAQAANDLRNLAMPPGLPENIVQQVKSALESNAAPLAKEAKMAVKQCASAAKKFKVLSEAAKACIAKRAPEGDPQANLTVPSVNAGRPAGAASLQRRLAAKPGDIKAIIKLGKLYLTHGNPYMARMILGKGLEVRETAKLFNLIGVAAARLSNFNDAYALFERALKRDVAYDYARVNKAALLAKFGHAKAARAETKKVRNANALTDGAPELISGALSRVGLAPSGR
ncbi:MAG: tetratricopeptide repeat protein [Deltaproteobacteria bacterium]|nr:tetratricopeptide repeat protein [Deltaproteobacteria bacterium]